MSMQVITNRKELIEWNERWDILKRLLKKVKLAQRTLKQNKKYIKRNEKKKWNEKQNFKRKHLKKKT